MEIIPRGQSLGLTWSWPGLGDSGTLCPCHCSACWGACATVWGTLGAPGHSGSQEGPKQGVPCCPQVPAAACPGTGSDQGLTLCPLVPGSVQARRVWAMLPLLLSPRGDSGSRDTLCGRAGSLIAGGCCLSGPRAHGPGDYHLPPADFQECQPVLEQTARHNGTALAAGCGPVGTDRAGGHK